MEQAKIKDLKKGEFIKRKADSNKVYIKGDYDRATKSFSCVEYEDINHEIFIKADKIVFYGFTF